MFGSSFSLLSNFSSQLLLHLSPSRPGLPLWLVPPITFFTFSYLTPFPLQLLLFNFLLYYSLHLSLSRPGLSLWQVPPFTFPFHFTLSFYLPIGPACHCGRSRLPYLHSLPKFFLYSPFYRPGLSLWQVPPPTFFLPHLHKFTPLHRSSQSLTVPHSSLQFLSDSHKLPFTLLNPITHYPYSNLNLLIILTVLNPPCRLSLDDFGPHSYHKALHSLTDPHRSFTDPHSFLSLFTTLLPDLIPIRPHKSCTPSQILTDPSQILTDPHIFSSLFTTLLSYLIPTRPH